jgi:hypothetical protein
VEIINETPYVLMPFDGSTGAASPALSFLVKGTFELRPELPALARGKDAQRPIAGDETYLDELGRSLRYSTDLVLSKARGEAMVTAICYAEGGRPRTACDATIVIGPIRKSLRVTGDRAWSVDARGVARIGRTEPFERVPIRWERAFGGMSYEANPLGRGIDAWPEPAGPTRWLPNVEYVEERVGDPAERPRPAGFGPVSPAWQPRAKRQGTRDQRWSLFRAPLPPVDFDPRFFNAAPDDQQIDGYFRGDEPVELFNLHPELPVYRTALPGKRLRLFVLHRGAKGAPPRFVEVGLNLDTVHVDVEAGELVLVWRRPVAVKSRAHAELEACYLTEEDLAREPAPLEAHLARFTSLRGEKDPPVHQAIDAEVEKQIAEAKKVLADAKVDPKLLEELDGMKDPQAIFDALTSFAQGKIDELEAIAASFGKPPP